VYVEYGRWTEGIEVEDERFDTENNKKKIWKVDPNACLLISDEEPNLTEIIINTDAISAVKKTLEY
jgi:sporulation protein YlmC with PRC-barrel domain